MAKNCVFVIIDPGTPHFWSSANIDLRPPILESEIDAFSFRMLRTILRKSGFIKWSFWKRTAKPLTPVKSTRFGVPIAPLIQAVRLLLELDIKSLKLLCFTTFIEKGVPNSD